jgi:two-component system, sensor histidine kinase and response regulator
MAGNHEMTDNGGNTRVGRQFFPVFGHLVMPWRFGFLLVIFSLVLYTPTFGETAPTPDSTKHILLINSYHSNLPWVEKVVQGIRDTIRPQERDLMLLVENMDTKHTPYTEDYKRRLRDLFEFKYRNHTFDLVMVSDNNAFTFMQEFSADLFPGVPVVFCGVNDFREQQIVNHTNFTGVAETFDAKTTLESAMALHPKTRQVFIINDHLPTGQAWTQNIKEQIGDLNNRSLTRAWRLPVIGMVASKL